MNAPDYMIIAVLAISLVLGVIRGFLREAIGLLGWLGGVWLAWRYAHLVAPFLGGLLTGEPQRTWVARALIVCTVLLIVWIIGGFITYFVHQSGLSEMLNRILGGLFGALRGAVLIALVTMLAQVVQLHQVAWWKQSHLLPYAEEVSHWIGEFAESASSADAAPHHKART